MNSWFNEWNVQAKRFRNECLKERERLLGYLSTPMETQKNVLFSIMEACREGGFGKAHQLENIRSIKSFQKNIPIRNYDAFSPWIEKSVQQRGGVFSKSPLARWLKTSGSTGSSKRIPYTEYWMSTFRVPALRALWGNYLTYVPDSLSSPFATLDMQTVRDKTKEFLNEIPYQGITNRNYLINESDWNPPWYNAPWFTEDVPEGYAIRMFYRLRYFLGQDLRSILTINPSTLVALHENITNHFDLLIQDINDGTIMGRKDAAPNPLLAKRLEAILSQECFSLKDIWPNLKMVSCWTSAAAKLYLPSIEKIFPDVKILPFMTCGTEGIVTLPIDDHPVTGPLAVNQGFYEFLPASVDLDRVISNEKGVETLLFNELELGEEYHLIMTQGSGMCRYAVGDLYKVTDFYQNVPRIEFSQRQGTYHSFTGEKITENQVIDMIEVIARSYPLSSRLFMLCPVWGNPPYYQILLEAEDTDNLDLHASLQNTIDYILRVKNEEYRSKRESLRLGPVKLGLVRPNTISNFQEKEKAMGNAIQYKYKPFQKDSRVFEELFSISANS